ncbi:hypothetical protein GJAV_G00108550 [Gymnothorax javanicus]|nr:hypothetical protein GJAV_G00108550 [Gymnothorax javanicus]
MCVYVLIVCSVLRRALGLSETHSLIGTYTAVNAGVFTSVLWLDGEKVDSYSNRSTVSAPRRNWMREGSGRYLWMSVKRLNMLQWDRGRTDILNRDEELNISEVVSSPTRKCALSPQELLHPRQWNRDRAVTADTRDYLEQACVADLLNSLGFEAKESPLTSPSATAVFAKRSNDTTTVILTCLVSGFRCRDTKVEMFRDEDILTEEDGLFSSGIWPNGDWTCQLRKSLDISNSTTASYSCEAHFQNQTKRVKWDGVIWNNAEPRREDNMRHHYWMPALFAVFFVLILGGSYRCANRQQKDRAPQYDADAETQLRSMKISQRDMKE